MHVIEILRISFTGHRISFPDPSFNNWHIGKDVCDEMLCRVCCPKARIDAVTFRGASIDPRPGLEAYRHAEGSPPETPLHAFGVGPRVMISLLHIPHSGMLSRVPSQAWTRFS